jgi:hypothetical protein
MPWLFKLRLKRLLKQFVIASMAYMTPIQATSQNLPSKQPSGCVRGRDLTAAARMRQSRAKRRAERAVTRAVTPAAGPERAVTSDVTRAVTGNETRAATDDVGNVPGHLAEIIDTDDLLVKLLDAAGGNVHSGANDTAPIAALLEQGCDLDLDVLPAVRHLLTDPI